MMHLKWFKNSPQNRQTRKVCPLCLAGHLGMQSLIFFFHSLMIFGSAGRPIIQKNCYYNPSSNFICHTTTKLKSVQA